MILKYGWSDDNLSGRFSVLKRVAIQCILKLRSYSRLRETDERVTHVHFDVLLERHVNIVNLVGAKAQAFQFREKFLLRTPARQILYDQCADIAQIILV